MFNKDDMYIIYKSRGDVFQLRDTKTHLVIATSTTLEGIKERLRNILNTYKHYGAYERSINGLSESLVSQKDYDKRSLEYARFGSDYSYLLEEALLTPPHLKEDMTKQRLKSFSPSNLEIEEDEDIPPVVTPTRVYPRKRITKR